MESAGLDELDKVGEGPEFGCEKEDCEIVVRDEAFGRATELSADVMEQPGTNYRGDEAGSEG